MYMRVTTVHGDPSRIDDVVALVRNRVRPVVDRDEDGRGVSLFVDRKGGRVVGTTTWATQQARNAAREELAPVRAEAARLMSGKVHTAEYEIAVAEPVAEAGPGSWMRAVAVTSDPARQRDLIAAFQTEAIPALRGVAGFCGAVLLVDESAGHAIGSTVWSSRAALADSRELTRGLREKVLAGTGAQVTGVAEYEVVLAEGKPQRHEALFRRAYEIMSSGDLAQIDDIVAEDFVEHAPVPPGLPAGREGLKAFLTAYRTAFPDLRMTMEKYLEQGDIGCAVVRTTGTNTGPLLGQPATGKAVDITAVDVVRVLDGRGVEHWGVSDDLGLLVQLGLAAAPGVAIPAQALSTSPTGSWVDA